MGSLLLFQIKIIQWKYYPVLLSAPQTYIPCASFPRNFSDKGKHGEEDVRTRWSVSSFHDGDRCRDSGNILGERRRRRRSWERVPRRTYAENFNLATRKSPMLLNFGVARSPTVARVLETMLDEAVESSYPGGRGPPPPGRDRPTSSFDKLDS